jgi:GT2 family glycosyltransferase/glycosyltransferase involved in cell wall biosynthesis
MNIGHPKASIVVLCYNGLKEVTQPCIASILANTPVDDYELIVVDNASADGTAAWVKETASRHTQIRPVCNQTNRGYAGGNNDGMRIAAGEYIILLNNDTLVPPGWLDALLRLLEERPEVGLVGPVTNSVGNEQRVELPGLTDDNYEAVSGEYVARHSGVWFPTEKLGFFCVAMRRALPEKIGYLDENFGVGMFEDDDYCVRAKRAGLTLAVAEDCFVYHKGSVSFKKLAFADYRALFERNRSYFFQKHKLEWTLTDLAFAYVDKFALDLAALDRRAEKLPPEIERLNVRLENFRHLLVQIYHAEIAGKPTMAGAATGAVTSPNVRRALWHTRRRLFKQMVLNGRWSDRAEFIRRAVNFLRRRMLQAAPVVPAVEVQPTALPSLNAIRDAHPDKKIVIFPATVDFHYMEQRPQQLARTFAELGYLVFYGTLNHNQDNVATVQQISANLYLLNEHAFPVLSHVFTPENVIYYCLWPNNIKHLAYLPCSRVIYDYMDELDLLELPADELKQQHRGMLARADLITVSAEQLFEKLPAAVQGKALLVPNAVSEQFIRTVEECRSVPEELAALGPHTPVLGYYGAIAEWLDFALLTELAQALPEAKIVLIGPVMDKAKAQANDLVTNHGNVLILPPRSQLDLVPFLKRFDICMIPFLKNGITDAVSPVKLFEYFAAGKPVISTALRECLRYPAVKISNDHRQFVEHARECLLMVAPPSEHIRESAKSNTWQLRVRQVVETLEKNRNTPGTTAARVE